LKYTLLIFVLLALFMLAIIYVHKEIVARNLSYLMGYIYR